MISTVKNSAMIVILLLMTSLAQAQFISVGPSAASPTSVTLNWATSAPTTGFVQWGTTIGFGNVVSSDTSSTILSKTHSLVISGLTPGIPYRYRIIATDIFGEIAFGNYQIFTTTVSPHIVSLSWNDSMTGLAFNVYRSLTAGGPYISLTANPILATVYTDSTVTPGQTYYYITTGFLSSNPIGKQESLPSNEVRVAIPTP